MAVNKARGRSPQRTDRVLSLVAKPANETLVRRLPTTGPGGARLDPNVTIGPGQDAIIGPGQDAIIDPGQDAIVGYAIELPDRTEDCSALRWNVVRKGHLVDADLASLTEPTTTARQPSSALRVTAGFVYRCRTQISSMANTDGFSGLCDAVRAACAGWSVGLLVLDEHPNEPAELASVYALNRSEFVDAKSTPPHLFELTFSYVGADDEVRSQSAYGSDALSSPVAAVSWLVAELGDQGRCLEPGDTVFSGGVTAPVPVFVGGTYRVVSSSLGIATDFGVGL